MEVLPLPPYIAKFGVGSFALKLQVLCLSDISGYQGTRQYARKFETL